MFRVFALGISNVPCCLDTTLSHSCFTLFLDSWTQLGAVPRDHSEAEIQPVPVCKAALYWKCQQNCFLAFTWVRGWSLTFRALEIFKAGIFSGWVPAAPFLLLWEGLQGASQWHSPHMQVWSGFLAPV